MENLNIIAKVEAFPSQGAEIFLLLSGEPAPDPSYVDRRIESALDETERRRMSG